MRTNFAPIRPSLHNLKARTMWESLPQKPPIDKRLSWSSIFSLCLVLTCVCFASQSTSSAQDNSTRKSLSGQQLKELNRVFVPASELSAVMAQDRIGAILPEKEFSELLQKAIDDAPPETHLPDQAIVKSVLYEMEVDGDRLIGSLTIVINAFDNRWSEVDFWIAGWNIEKASLDGEIAALARDGDQFNRLRVFINKPGEQTLQLDISGPLEAAGGDKATSFGLVRNGTGEFRLTLPAGKHLELAGSSVARPADISEAATYRIPIGGQQDMSLTITDRQKTSRGEVLTFASTAMGLNVQPGEVTWVAQTELQIFGQEIDRLICSVPGTLEITSIESNGLESWELSDDPNDVTRTRITLQYRQGIEGRRTVTFQGILSVQVNEPWSAPTLLISSVTSHTGVIVVKSPVNLRLQSIESNGVRAVDPSQANVPPTSSGESHANYQIWDENFSLRFVTNLKEQEVHAALTNVLDITHTELNLYTAVSLEARLAPLFDFRLRIPADWEVTNVHVGNQRVLWETLSDQAGINEIRVPLDPPLLPGQARDISLFSRYQPDGWPLSDQMVRIAIPEIRLPQAAMVEALYGISASEDLDVTPQEITGLDPAGQQDVETLNTKLKSLNKSVKLGFTYQDSVFSGQLDVSRKPALLTAQTITFFRVDKEHAFTRLEILLDVTGGGYRELQLLMSESAGDKLRFSIVTDVQSEQAKTRAVRIVEQLPGEVENGLRRWTLRFDQYLHGQYRLMSDVRIPREADGESFSPARVQLPDAEIVSGDIAVEGSSEELLTIIATDAGGAPLPTVDPVDFPPAYYQPQERVVAGYRSIHADWQLNASVTEFDRGAIPTVIGHRAQITSVVSEAGEFQHQMTLVFTAVGAQSLLVNLPDEATLWSTIVDGVPVEVRQSPEGTQVPIAGLSARARHTLQLTYETRDLSLQSMKALTAVPPSVSVVDGKGGQQSVEVLVQDWDVHLPEETVVIASQGKFVPVGDLFLGSFFTSLRNLITVPSSKSVNQRITAFFVALVVLLVVWLIRRAVSSAPPVQTRSGSWLTAILIVLVLTGGVLAFMMSARQQPRSAATESSVSREVASDAPLPSSHFLKDEVQYSPDRERQLFDRPALQVEDRENLSYSTSAGSKDNNQPFAPPQAPTSLPQPAQQPMPGEGASNESFQIIVNGQAEPGFAEPNNRRFGSTSLEMSRMDQESDDIRFRNSRIEMEELDKNINGNAGIGGMLGGSQPQFGDELSLQVQQTQTPTPQAESSAEAIDVLGRDESTRSYSTGGLLSMTFNLEIPEGTRSQKFHYQGNGLNADQVDLRIRFADRTTGQILIWSIALGIAVLGWWLRNSSTGTLIMWAFVTVLLPLALAGVLPVIWRLLLEGVFFGGLATIAVWIVRCTVRWCSKSCFTATSTPAVLIVTAVFASRLGTPTHADEPVTPIQEAKPFVVIPYESLDQIDAADRVFVPQDIYQQLWSAAHPEELPTPDGPVKFTISEASYRLHLTKAGEDHQIQIHARWVVTVMTDEAVAVTIPVTNAAVTSVNVAGKAATVQTADAATSQVVLQGRGPQIVDATMLLPADVNGLVGQFTLQHQAVGSSLFTFDLPEADEELRVQVNAMQRSFRRVTKDGKSQIEFSYDRGGTVIVTWYPAAQQGGMNRSIQLETAIAASLRDDGIDVSHGIRARVRQGVINELDFSVPDGLAVRELTGRDVGGWEIEEKDGQRILKVFFRNEVDNETDFSINLFQKLDIGEDQVNVAVPTLSPLEISRETVQLALYTPDHLRIRAAGTTGLNQIDVSGYVPVVAPQIAGSVPQLAYRTSSRPLELNVTVRRLESEARTIVEHGVHIARRKQLVATRIAWTLTGAPRRRVDVAIPDGYLPISVICADASDWYVHQGNDGQILTMEFPQPKTGQIEAGLEGHLAKLPDDTSITLSLPHPIETNGQQTTLGVWLDAGYQGSIAQIGGWKSIRPEQLSHRYQVLDPKPVQFAFSSDDSEPASAVLDVRSATAKVTGDSVTLIAVGDATVDYGLTLRWNISQAATDEFIFTTPSWLENVEITGPSIRQSASEDLGNGRTRWTVTLVDPVSEQYLLTIASTIPFPDDQTVQTPFVEFESRQPGGAVTPLTVQQQFAFLVNLSPSQLVPVDLNQFESVSVERLPLKIHEELLQQAVEIVQVRLDKLPSWSVQKMEELSIAKAQVLAAHLQTVLELDGSWRTLATFGVRNRGRQFMALRLPEETRILSIFVRNQPSRTVMSQIDGEDIHLIALPQTSAADLSFEINVLLAGRFANPLKTELALTGKEFELPSPGVLSLNESADFGMPVSQTLWTVHFPEEVDATVVTGVKSTNLTPHDEDPWIAIEEQTLERLQTDVAEMTRMLADKTISSSQRTQSLNNLKQLNLELKYFNREYLANSVSGSEGEQKREQLIATNKKLQTESATAIDQAETMEIGKPVSQSGKAAFGNRAYISGNNDMLITNNSINAGELGIEEKSVNFNFLQDSIVNERKSDLAASKDSESRSKLKSQIQSQQLLGLSDQPNVNNPNVQLGTSGLQHGGFAGGRSFGGGDGGGFGEESEAAQQGEGQQQMPQNYNSSYSDIDGNAGLDQTFRQGLIRLRDASDFSQLGEPRLVNPRDMNADASRAFLLMQDGAIQSVAPPTDGEVAGRVSGESIVPVRPWSAAGGLSIAMELPKNVQTLSFSKVGGNPVLTLDIQPAETQETLWGLAWCAVVLVASLLLIRAFRSAESRGTVTQLLMNLVILIGLLGFCLLPPDLAWLCFWVFGVASFIRIVLPRRSGLPSAA